MLEVRKTLETDWAWRVAAYTAGKGLTDEEIQAVLRGPLAMPDVSEVVTALRELPPGEQAKLSESVGRPEETAGTQERERSDGDKTGDDNAARTAEVAAPDEKEVTSGVVPEDLPSVQVVHLSHGEGARDEAETAASGAAQEQAP